MLPNPQWAKKNLKIQPKYGTLRYTMYISMYPFALFSPNVYRVHCGSELETYSVFLCDLSCIWLPFRPSHRVESWVRTKRDKKRMPHILGMHIGEIPHEPISLREWLQYMPATVRSVYVYAKQWTACLLIARVCFEKEIILSS